MRVALRVQARSLRGLREGIPNLLRLFGEYQVRASFFFPLGRDLSGRHLRKTWRERQLLGWPALAYGTLLAAPSLSMVAAGLMVSARGEGHEVGLCGLSPQRWADQLAYADDPWVEQQGEALWTRYLGLGGETPCALATPNWQVHPGLLRGLSASRYRYSTLTRGRYPYYPVLQGVRSAIPEIPTTLPTADELLCQPGVSSDNVHEYLYAESRHLLPAGHVYAVSAEREGLDLLPLMEKLLVMWRGQGGSIRTLGDALGGVDTDSLPHHQAGWGAVAGGQGQVAMQSIQVPA